VRTDDRFMLILALRGFHGARARFDGSSAVEAFIPAGEAVYWACVLDEQLNMLEPHRYGASAETGRSIIKGVRYARNRYTHQLPMILHETRGMTLPITMPLRLSEIRWQPASDLPERPGTNKRDNRDDGGREHYIKHLSDKPVRHTLDQIAGWFALVQRWDNSLLLPGVEERDQFLEYARSQSPAFRAVHAGPDTASGIA
jgi:hypothetical protein